MYRFKIFNVVWGITENIKFCVIKKNLGLIHHTVEVSFADTTIIVAYTRKQFREASLYALKVMR